MDWYYVLVFNTSHFAWELLGGTDGWYPCDPNAPSIACASLCRDLGSIRADAVVAVWSANANQWVVVGPQPQALNYVCAAFAACPPGTTGLPWLGIPCAPIRMS